MQPIVVGAGIAGLTAAYEFVEAELRPVVIEPDHIGGFIESRTIDGFTLECGPNVLVERPELKQLISELGIQASVRYPAIARFRQYVWCDGRPQVVPKSLIAFATSSLFDVRTKLVTLLRLSKRGVLPTSGDDLSVADFLAPVVGRRAVAQVVDPVLKGIYGGDVELLSARSLFSGLWTYASEGGSLLSYMRSRKMAGGAQIVVLDGGIENLVRSLWNRLEPHVQFVKARAQALEEARRGVYTITCSDGSVHKTDAVVCAMAGEALARLLSSVSGETSRRLKEMQYASLAVLHLSVPRSVPLLRDGFGVLFPAGMPSHILGVMFNSLVFPHVAPPDQHLLTVIAGGSQARDAPLVLADLEEKAPEFLERQLAIIGARVVNSRLWNRAVPQLNVGHYRLVAELDRLESQHAGLAVIGVDRGGVGVSDRVRIAREGAQRILLQLGRASVAIAS